MLNIVLASAAVLILVILILMFRVQSLLAIQRNSDERKGGLTNKVNAALFIVFGVVMGALAIWYTFAKADTYSLPKSASIHGNDTDTLFLITMAVCGLVVLLTHILLFGFSFKYQFKKERKAKYYPDNHILELVWTLIPAVVLAFLVFQGWKVWSNVMAEPDAKKLEISRSTTDVGQREIIEVEAIAQQFGWEFRYPGKDGKFGRHDFRKLSLTNTIGYDFSDPENLAALDDFSSSTLMLPKDKEILVKIRSKDVIHSFYLPHMRVKMDAVPGMPTTFRFTPTMTTMEMKAYLATQPSWNIPDEEDSTKTRANSFKYEVVCAEICGKGHYTMKGAMDVVSNEKFSAWYEAQEPWANKNKDYVLQQIKSSYNMKAAAEFEVTLDKNIADFNKESGDATPDTPEVDETPKDSLGTDTLQPVIEPVNSDSIEAPVVDSVTSHNG